MIQLVRLRFLEGKQISDIAKQLHITRVTYSKLLRRAFQIKLVEHKVNLPDTARAQSQLREAFEAYGLRGALVIDIPVGQRDIAQLRLKIGEAAAGYCDELMQDYSRQVFAFGGGGHLREMAIALARKERGVILVPTIIPERGPRLLHTDSYALISLLLAKCGWESECYGMLLAPMGKGNVRKKDADKALENLKKEHAALIKNKAVKILLSKMRDAKVVFISCGPLSHDDFIGSTRKAIEAKGLSIEFLKSKGVVGDLNYSFINSSGGHVVSPWLGLNGDELKRLISRGSEVVLVSGGNEKSAVIRAALKGGMVTRIITDLGTSQLLLDSKV